MINHTGSGRRILSYPAILPCDSISPATLLHSLINLATAITTTTFFFSTNRRNAATAFRHVSNLLHVFHDMDHQHLPNHLVLTLSELHLAFQKLLALLHDCTRPDARLWMLLNSQHVSTAFRLSIRAISTALDVFPLHIITISTRELLDLVTRQTWTSTFRPDPKDLLLSDVLLNRILPRLEHGVDPDPEDIALLTAHLRITSWTDCHNELKFLESEIQLDFCNPEKEEEVELLNSLAGYIMYCRVVVLFDTAVDFQPPSQRSEITEEQLKGINLDDLRCPISLEIMSDPVTLASTGQTYDRSSITKWFSSGNVTCPNTGEKLASTTDQLIPNLAVKGIILNQQYCLRGNSCVVAAEPSGKKLLARAGSLAAEGAMKLLASFLVNKLITAADKQSISKADFEIRVLTKTSIFNRSCMISAGAIPLLLALLSSEDSTTQENAIAALLNLSKHPTKSRALMVENPGLKSILDVLKKGLKDEAKQHAAGVIFYLASVDEYRATVSQNPVTIPALVDLIKNGNDRCKRNALVAIFGLLQDPENQYQVLASGIVPLLLDLLKDEKTELVTDSLAVLAVLAERVDGTVVGELS